MKNKIAICIISTAALAVGASAQGRTGNIPPMAVVQSPIAIPIAPVAPLKEPYRPTGLDEIIRAKFPLAVTYKELGFGWREVEWRSTVYFSKGETQRVNDTEYLVAYRFEPQFTSQLSAAEYAAVATGNVRAYAPDDRFVITLIAMNELLPYLTGGGTNLRSFDPARRRAPFDASAVSPAFNQSLALIYLEKIFQATRGYAAAYLQTLPPMESAFAARQALLPFAENAAIFQVPGTDEPFKANPLFSGRKLAHLRNRHKAVLFYQAVPAEDGLRAVLLVSGRTRRVDEKSWRYLKEISELE
jgi:hypothetical protein